METALFTSSHANEPARLYTMQPRAQKRLVLVFTGQSVCVCVCGLACALMTISRMPDALRLTSLSNEHR